MELSSSRFLVLMLMPRPVVDPPARRVQCATQGSGGVEKPGHENGPARPSAGLYTNPYSTSIRFDAVILSQ